jgi:DNA mismatch repair protein MutL
VNKIKALPLEVYEKIKAGEVIEDVASVVRELLDNAIDSKATSIKIELEEGGIEAIRIEDNGTGMNQEDLLLCYLPHTTSKITSYEDIFKLQTAGFRGEALSSIARVAFLKIISSDNRSGLGHSVNVEGGKFLKDKPEPFQQGTQIEVKNLFYNVPVRKNMISSPVKETRKAKEEILLKTLSYPEIAFELKINRNLVFSYQSKNWEERIREVFSSFAENLIPFSGKSKNVSIKGVMTNLNTTFSSSENLYFFINHKPVRSRFLYGVINSIFSTLIPNRRYPGGVIYIYLDPCHIDPNIHPSKKEIKIFIEDEVYREFYKALKKLYYPNNEQFQSNDFKESLSETKANSLPLFQNKFSPDKNPEISLDFTANLQENTSGNREELGYKYLGVVFDTYLVVQKDEDLLFIDFHAAHERSRYELLLEQFSQSQVQKLLYPKILNLSEKEVQKISEYREIIEKLGFAFYLFGEESVVVNGIPSFYQDKDWEDDFRDLLFLIFQKTVLYSEIQEEILKKIACRGSYMSKDRLPDQEALQLLKLIFTQGLPTTCPHGRPYIYTLPRKDLAARFLRSS